MLMLLPRQGQRALRVSQDRHAGQSWQHQVLDALCS